MAEIREVRVVSDLDGEDGADTATFGFAGRTYEVDLTDKQLEELRDFLQPYIAAGRGTGGGRGRRQSSAPAAPSKSSSRQRTQAIRDWARENGHQVSDRGRISRPVVEAFEAAH